MPDSATNLRRRRRVFVLVLLASLAVALVSITLSVLRGSGSTPGAPREPAADNASAPPTSIPASGAVVFRSLDRADPADYAHVAWAPVDRPEQARTVTGLGCERVHFAGGHGICLVKAGKLGTSIKARLFDSDMRPTDELKLNGVGSRARMSPDGRLATVTAFVSGHSYADVGAFSTRATIIDVERGREIADLEDFAITKDGKPLQVARLQLLGRDLRATTATASTPRSRAGARLTSSRATCGRGTRQGAARERRVPVAVARTTRGWCSRS